jgi:hypothetical protein
MALRKRDVVNIKVLLNWEVEGFGVPIYVNQFYPFYMDDPTPTFIPKGYNPVGSYWSCYFKSVWFNVIKIMLPLSCELWVTKWVMWQLN